MTEADGTVLLEEEVHDEAEEDDRDVGGPAVRYTIANYGADYPVDGLVKRISSGDIYVPDFQRGYVWTHAQASRFIESLLLGLPVPGIFLFKEPDTQKLVVVDGQQRLRTLEMFYEGVLRGRQFSLRGVCDELEGSTYKTLADEDRRRLDDAIVHATIFQQDDPQGDRSSVYLIFERLNTGGTALAPQEIRSCVYRGTLNELLKELVDLPGWRDIYGPPSRRAKDQELVLRFFALYYESDKYFRPMKQFLNEFMERNRDLSDTKVDEMRSLFERTSNVAASYLTRDAFRPERNLSVAVLDALFVGLAKRLDRGEVREPEELKKAASRVLSHEIFSKAISSGTTHLQAIRDRLRIAEDSFAAVA